MLKSISLIQKAIIAFSFLAFAQVSADCCISNECNTSYSNGIVYVRGDVLYLRAVQDGLSSCGPALILDDLDQDGYPITRICSHCKNPNHNWDFGYRVAAGLRLSLCEPSPWEIAGAWTHYSQGSSLDCSVLKNDSKWRLKFDYADLLLAYYLSACNSVNIKLFGGIRGAIIDQHLHNFFINQHDDFAITVPRRGVLFTNVQNEQKFRGLGPLLGFEAGWDFGCGFNIFFNGDVGCLFGDHHTKKHRGDIGEDSTFVSENRCKQQEIQYFVDSALGLRWNILLCGTTELSLQIGVEQHTYFNFNYLTDRGNLNIYGGTFSAGLKF